MASYRFLSGRHVAVAALVAAVGVTAAANSSSLPAVHAMPLAVAQRHDPVKNKKRRDDGLFQSTNWSGYSVTGADGSVTIASGSWIVPAVTCDTTSAQYSSFWVGIDGFNSNTVEQTGTDSDCSGKTPQYYAWFEFYPKASYLINASAIGNIGPGTVMSATITLDPATSIYTVTLVNNSSSNKTFSIQQKVASARASSAEWIAEAPSSGGVLTIANFGTAQFLNSRATIGGANGTIGSFLEDGCSSASCSDVVQELTMVQPTGAGGQPSSLDKKTGGAFSVAYVPPSTQPPPKKHGKG
jgi:hypothetical protein